MSIGLFVWCVAVLFSGLAPNYFYLVAARALSGVGEASFQTIAPAFIDDRAPPGKKVSHLGLLSLSIFTRTLNFIVAVQ